MGESARSERVAAVPDGLIPMSLRRDSAGVRRQCMFRRTRASALAARPFDALHPRPRVGGRRSGRWGRRRPRSPSRRASDPGASGFSSRGCPEHEHGARVHCAILQQSLANKAVTCATSTSRTAVLCSIDASVAAKRPPRWALRDGRHHGPSRPPPTRRTGRRARPSNGSRRRAISRVSAHFRAERPSSAAMRHGTHPIRTPDRNNSIEQEKSRTFRKGTGWKL